MADPMTMSNPYVDLAVGGASFVTDITGLIMQKQALDEARTEARSIDKREVAYRAGRDKVSDRLNKESLKMSKEKLGLERSLAMHGLNKDKISQIENMFSNNIALQDRALRMWGRT
jgi:hypothetical protein